MNLNEGIYNLKILMEEGRIKFLDDSNLKESLRNIKVRPDGSIVESSVDSRIRALLLALEAAKMDETLNICSPEFLEKIKSMNKEEREKYFLSLPREKAAAYKEIFMRVGMLEDFYYILSNMPKDSFKNIFNLSIKEMNENPADALKDYIVLEINKFYELTLQEKKIKLPSPPEYSFELENIRNIRIAHPDKRNKSNESVEKLYRAIDKIGLDNIVNEFKRYAITCIYLINNS